MTNAEAIEYIKKNCYGEWCEDDWREAMDMAIEALKCSETPKSSERTSETAQADHIADIGKKVDGDCISRQAAIDAFGLSEKTRKYGGDHSGYDTRMLYEIQDTLESLPAVQPEPKWIPCSERLPENDNEVLITVWDAEDDYVEVYKGFYQGHEWWTQWCHGCSKIKDEPCGENIVIAWKPLPEPYRGGEK